MARVFGMGFLPEMLCIWLVELAICFCLFYVPLHASLGFPVEMRTLGGYVDLAVVNAFILALTVSLVGFMTGLYRAETCLETKWLLLKATMSACLSLLAVWAVAMPSHINVLSVFGGDIERLIGMFIAWGTLLVMTRLLYAMASRMNLVARHVVVFGADTANACAMIASSRRGLFHVESSVSHAANRARLPRRLWAVVYTGKDLPTGVPRGVRVFDLKSFAESQLGRIDVATTASIQFEPPPAPSFAARLTRRFLDIVLSLLLLLFTAPLWLLTAILVRAESPGPVFYGQERVGLNGRTFTLWKFRSMCADAERLGPSWASLKDHRVTAVGRVIRKIRADELPQLINIVRGDMSLVGPRPERPYFVEQLAHSLPLYRERSQVKPGLTGWAQVNYPYGSSIEDAWAKLSYDLYYIKYRNLLFDLHIVLATVRVILFQEGAR